MAVTVSGTYDGEHQFLVPGRSQSGQAAVYVVTPLKVADGRVGAGRARVAAGGSRAGLSRSAPAPSGGPVTVTGWLVPSESLEAGTVDALALPEGQLATITAARVAGLLPYPIIDGYVGRRRGGPDLPRPGLARLEVPQIEPTVRWSAQSLFYAFEWWFFALVVLWMGVQAWRIEQRRVRTDPVEAGADQAAVPPPGLSGSGEVCALGAHHARLDEEDGERDRARHGDARRSCRSTSAP